MSEKVPPERSVILFLDDADYVVPALVHALGANYRELVLARCYKTIDKLLSDGQQLGRVDIVGLDVSEEVKPGEHDFTFGAKAYRKCMKVFWDNDRSKQSHALFMSRWWSDKIEKQFEDHDENNPFKIGSGIVLPKPVASITIMKYVSAILDKDWRSYDIEPEIAVCGASANDRLLYAYGIATENQGKRGGAFSFTYYPIPSARHYESTLLRIGGPHILLLDTRFPDLNEMLNLASRSVRARVILTEVVDLEHDAEITSQPPTLISQHKEFPAWVTTCKLGYNEQGRSEIALPSLMEVYRSQG